MTEEEEVRVLKYIADNRLGCKGMGSDYYSIFWNLVTRKFIKQLVIYELTDVGKKAITL